MSRIAFVLLSLTAFLALAGCQSQRPAEVIRADADWAMEHGDYATAARHYGEIADRYPGDWRAQHQLGLAEMELGNLTGARRALEIALTQRPDSPDLADAFAEVLFRQHDLDRLFAFLRERTTQAQTVRAYRRLARYAIQASDPDTATTAIDTAIAISDGESVDPYLDAAALAEQLGDLELAVLRLRQAYWINAEDERVSTRLRALGEIPGPTLALPPDEEIGG